MKRSIRDEELALTVLLLAVGVVSVAPLGCSRRTNTLDVSPPLPPAEEPSDEVEGVYAGDAGSQP